MGNALEPINPCPICGAETAVAEIEPHPLHVNLEIHGFLCDRCGPVKSLVVPRSPPLQPLMLGIMGRPLHRPRPQPPQRRRRKE